MMNIDNPLLQQTEWPAFDAIRPEHVGPAIDELLQQAHAALELAVGPQVPADYDALSMVLDVPVEHLTTVWGHVSHLQAVADTPELRQAHADSLPRVIEFTTRLGADERLYAKYKALAHGEAANSLSPTRKKVLSDALRDFVLGGAELHGADRERYAAIQDRSAELAQEFGDHVLDATEAFVMMVSESELDGVPEDVKQAARENASGALLPDGQAAFKLSLKMPCYLPVITYAHHRPLRLALFRANHTRASELGPAAWDNSALMQEMLALRQEEAQLLGHATYAELSLVAKMARSPGEVLKFVRDLVQRARPYGNRELAELQDFSAQHLGLDDLQAWDRAYASEKLKQQRYDFSGEEVRQYFTEPRVLDGLFRLIETLFDVAIHTAEAPVWHPSVRYFRLWRGERPVAAFYLDLHAREGKQGGAWMSDARCRWRRPDGVLQDPVAHLVCNFAPPVGDQPSLLTHDDVITLFHEFGHGLHHMLTQVEDLPVSGIAGVEGDATELPSQFMENFCWEWEVLQKLSAHVSSAEPLPRALFERMVAARHFQSGLLLLRQCEFALFDMRLHAELASHDRVQALADEVNAEVQPVLAPAFARYAHSFRHVFDGGYGAGYYGYAWAEVLSSDAYSAFEEAGVFDPAMGERFRSQILEVGGSRPALESFVAFRGREPQLDAMLRHLGLGSASSA